MGPLGDHMKKQNLKKNSKDNEEANLLNKIIESNHLIYSKKKNKPRYEIIINIRN